MTMSRNNDYKTGNLLYFSYFKENCRLIATELSKQTKLKNTQEINFIVNQANGSSSVFHYRKSEEATFEILQNSVSIL